MMAGYPEYCPANAGKKLRTPTQSIFNSLSAIVALI